MGLQRKAFRGHLTVLAAIVALLAIIAGAIPGIVTIHAVLAVAAVVLAGIRVAGSRAARVAVAVGIVESLIQTPVLHATLSPVFFAACVAIALKPGDDAIVNSGLRMPIKASPALVLMQIVLGACYRHKIIGVMPHMAGAVVLAGLLLIICTVVLQRFPKPSPLRTAAGALTGVVLAQVSLGIAVFILRLLDLESTAWFVAAAVAHIAAGSLTLAATTALALRVGSGAS
jgi:heme A synthase